MKSLYFHGQGFPTIVFIYTTVLILLTDTDMNIVQCQINAT